MYADPAASGGVLEPEGIVEIKYRTPDLLATMHRLDPVLQQLKVTPAPPNPPLPLQWCPGDLSPVTVTVIAESCIVEFWQTPQAALASLLHVLVACQGQSVLGSELFGAAGSPIWRQPQGRTCCIQVHVVVACASPCSLDVSSQETSVMSALLHEFGAHHHALAHTRPYCPPPPPKGPWTALE